MHSGKLVTLAVYESLSEARRVKKKLEDAGIPAYLGGEALALVGPKRGLTSLKLEVAEEDLEHARLVLETPLSQASALPVERPDEIHEDGLASITIFYDTVEAEHAAQLLRAHGIPCELLGKPSGFMAMIAPGILNIVLVVQEEDADRAYDILGFTHESDDPDNDTPPEEEIRASPHAIRSELPPPASEPGHIKRQTQTVQPASEDSPVEPAITSPPVEAPQLDEQPQREYDAKRGPTGWVLVLFVLLLVLLILAALRVKL